MRSGHPPPVRTTNQPKEQFLRHPRGHGTCATHCEHVEQENLDAQNGWRHPVPALMTHVLVPLEKSASRLSCLSYKICLHNVRLHPTHTIPHPWHLDHRDKCHLKRLPTECLFLRRCLAFGKTDRKKLSHMQCMFLSHFKHVLMPIMQPAFFTSGQTKQTAFTASSNSCFQELHHTHPLSPTKMTSRMVLPSQSHDIQRTFLRLCRYSSGAKGLELSLAYVETLWDWSLNVWQHKMQLIWPLGRWVTRLVLKAPGQVIMGIWGIKGVWRLKVPLELTLANFPWARMRPYHSKFHSLWRSWNSPKWEILDSFPQRSCEASQSSVVVLMPAASSPSPVPSRHDLPHCTLGGGRQRQSPSPATPSPQPCPSPAELQPKQPQLSLPVSTGKVLQPSYHLCGPKVILAYNLLLMPSFFPENHEGSQWLGLVNYLFV